MAVAVDMEVVEVTVAGEAMEEAVDMEEAAALAGDLDLEAVLGEVMGNKCTYCKNEKT